MTAVDGQYQIGIYATRPISYGEEITFDYNSVTEVWFFLGTFSAHYIDQLFCVTYFHIYNLFNCRVKKNMKLQYVSVEVKYVGAAISVWQVKKLFRMYELPFFFLISFPKVDWSSFVRPELEKNLWLYTLYCLSSSMKVIKKNLFILN